MKSITIKDVLALKPCDDYDTEEKLKPFFGRRKSLTAKQILAMRKLPNQDKVWVLLNSELLSDSQKHLIDCDIAEQIALPIWDKYYPEDKRPSDAIKIERLWLEGKATDEQLDVARNNAWNAIDDAKKDEMWYAANAAINVAWVLNRIPLYRRIGTPLSSINNRILKIIKDNLKK